ncbi:transketolase [Phenylobacterium sp.]|uniref:transketolase n=1 Tax=Phenylobacterium sp. TaxID=1871053 RepID=UPI002E322B15|nr:transketolase [Phenylobacterium sp.]HEX4709597.1 transketolase [Phenylobacterium sp.]
MSGAADRFSADLDTAELAIDTIRTLAIDAVEKAQSGHAGAPMGLAPVAYTLWTRFLRYDPKDPTWINRDRFVLSAGHASMLLYSLLHLAGVEAVDSEGKPQGHLAVSLDDIEHFRQLGSVTPGHPEYRHTTGVEATTGPLGQGCGDSVGMAMAERWLEARFNEPDRKLFEYNVYVICSDGDMMEGVASEAASLAGHLKLSNLCWIYDDNRVTIEGHTDLAFSEDVAARFRAYGWATLDVNDANDTEAFAWAIETFRKTSDRPTFIRVKSVIGYGSPHKQGTSKIHSDPLGADEVRLTKAAYGWPQDAEFRVPDGVREQFAETLGARGRALRQAWEADFGSYREAEPDLARQLDLVRGGELPQGWDRDIPSFPADAKGIASREASGKTLNAVGPHIPWLLGGAADLAPSTKTKLEFDGAGTFSAEDYGGRNLHFGVREHAMGAIANGLALSNLRPYTGTFLIFSDYMRPPTRLAALMELPVVFVFTHDSIGLGEDGPTHQPIEQLAALRAIPGLITLRPCDANETAEAWRLILGQSQQPACLVLSRQALPTLDRARYAAADGLRRGAYVLADGGRTPQVILMATGSEVSICVEVHERLTREGVAARVVSMPSWDLFEKQDQAYRDQVLPPDIVGRVAIEQGASLGWDRYVGLGGAILAMHTFGASAPIADLKTRFGFTPDQLYEAAKAQAARGRP